MGDYVSTWLFTMNVSLCECVSVCIGYLKGKMSEENQNNQVQICRSDFFSVNRSLGVGSSGSEVAWNRHHGTQE